MKIKAHVTIVTIDINDIRAAGSVGKAIFAWAEGSDDTSSGYTQSAESQPTYAIQWRDGTKAVGYAARAMEGGALYYVDHTDGRMIGRSEVDDCEDGTYTDEDAVHHDFGGGHFLVGDWSDESVVSIECPSIEDAIEYPEIVAEMAQSVIDYHFPMSDRAEWKKLIEAVKEAADALSDIDADDLAD